MWAHGPSQCRIDLWVRRGWGLVLPMLPSSSMKPKESNISESNSGLPGHFEGIFVKVRGQDMFYVTDY